MINMGSGNTPICKKCKRKQSYAITRYETKKSADTKGYCVCVFKGLKEVSSSEKKGVD